MGWIFMCKISTQSWTLQQNQNRNGWKSIIFASLDWCCLLTMSLQTGLLHLVAHYVSYIVQWGFQREVFVGMTSFRNGWLVHGLIDWGNSYRRALFLMNLQPICIGYRALFTSDLIITIHSHKHCQLSTMTILILNCTDEHFFWRAYFYWVRGSSCLCCDH